MADTNSAGENCGTYTLKDRCNFGVENIDPAARLVDVVVFWFVNES